MILVSDHVLFGFVERLLCLRVKKKRLPGEFSP